MTGHQINSLVGDLVAMAQAMERLPQVEARVSELEGILTSKDSAFNGLLADFNQAKDYAASLEQKVRDLEVARDAAETMFLEADDRTMRAVEFIKAQFGAAGSLIQALEPPKPQPEPQPQEHTSSGWNPNVEPIPEPQVQTQWDDKSQSYQPMSQPGYSFEPLPVAEAQGQSESPLPASSGHMEAGSSGTTEAGSTQTAHSDPIPPTVGDQSATLPSAEVGQTQESASSSPANATDVGSTTAGTSSVSQPYAGLMYFNCVDWISRADWIAGGGTNYTYDWRPKVG